MKNLSSVHDMQCALITGASSGIGRALAVTCAQKGYTHLILIARRQPELEALSQELHHVYGTKCLVLTQDLETPTAAQAVFDAVTQSGWLVDTLINNAGFGHYSRFENYEMSVDQNMIQVNISTLVSLTKLFLPQIIKSRGRILNVASVASFLPGPFMAVYYATKAFVLSFSEALAEELAHDGVRVTALCPGATQSEFVGRASMSSSALVKGKRLPTAECVARQGVEAMLRGRRICVTGWMNKCIVFSPRLLPKKFTTWIVRLLSRPV